MRVALAPQARHGCRAVAAGQALGVAVVAAGLVGVLAVELAAGQTAGRALRVGWRVARRPALGLLVGLAA